MLTAEDRLAIQDLVVLYGFIVDERQFSRTHEIFTDDAVYDVSEFKAGVHLGHAAIAKLWAETDAHPLAHHATNILIGEDAGVVRVASKGIGVQADGRVGSVTYHDVAEKRPEGWRLTRRVASRRRADRIPEPS